MKSNNKQKIRQDNSCAVISAIFACIIREAIISVLTERAAPLRRSLNHRDSLKFVQEVARFVTSRFFGKKRVSRGSEKLLNWQHCRRLYYSPLSLSDCSSTRIFTSTLISNIWTTANQRGVRPSLSLIGLDHDMGLMCVCCWNTGSRGDFFFFFSNCWSVRPQIFFCRTLDKLGRTCDQIGRTLEPCKLFI